MTTVVTVVFTSCPTRGGQQRNQFNLSHAYDSYLCHLQELPAPIVDDPGPDTGQEVQEESDHMKIAWRYRHLPKFQVL